MSPSRSPNRTLRAPHLPNPTLPHSKICLLSPLPNREHRRKKKFNLRNSLSNLRTILMKTLETPRITFITGPSSKSMNEEWSKAVKRSSEAIRISSPTMTICCSIWGTAIEALHDSSVEACIMSEFLMDTFIGSMPLDPTDILFRSPSGLFFECRGIARAVPAKIDKIENRIYVKV